ncbi:hypothetical protein L6164_028396 [Bauhinia variegata]|uniref:Uncharacterized protein n=1 Tax=Bauhinia variegata TaxID=167791 RepID=A0ACB9L619_BAUVA|nr:hypothetical protein L6164_028396 [Bauhinia variegata]
MKAFLKDADRRATTEGDVSEGIRTWPKQLREAAFRIEDLIDEYLIYLVPQSHHSGCSAPLYKFACQIKTMKPCNRFAREIQDIKSLVQGIQERRTRYDFVYHQISSIRTQNVNWQGYHLNSHFIEEVDVVGFEGPKDELVCWLMRETKERDVISVVGIGGLGKTTLAKIVFDINNKGSKIIITTRNIGVAEYCKKSCLVHIHELQPLPHNKAWELFCKKAFHFEFEGQYPDELVDLSNEIVQRCKGLKFWLFCAWRDDQSISDRVTRRLSLATNVQAVMSVDYTSIRSIYICKPGVLLPKSYVHKLVTKFKLLKVVDFERASLDYISDNLGNLCHLRYLSLRETGVKSLPKSIGKLQNLETLDLRQTLVSELPIEINKLTKLRHRLVYH